MNYRTIPESVQAIQWNPVDEEKVVEMLSWLIFNGAQVAQVLGSDGNNRLAIGRPGEQVYANRSDWVVWHTSGLGYAIKTAEEFARRYEKKES